MFGVFDVFWIVSFLFWFFFDFISTCIFQFFLQIQNVQNANFVFLSFWISWFVHFGSLQFAHFWNCLFDFEDDLSNLPSFFEVVLLTSSFFFVPLELGIVLSFFGEGQSPIPRRKHEFKKYREPQRKEGKRRKVNWQTNSNPNRDPKKDG